jgi:hypothetical protein
MFARAVPQVSLGRKTMTISAQLIGLVVIVLWLVLANFNENEASQAVTLEFTREWAGLIDERPLIATRKDGQLRKACLESYQQPPLFYSSLQARLFWSKKDISSGHIPQAQTCNQKIRPVSIWPFAAALA